VQVYQPQLLQQQMQVMMQNLMTPEQWQDFQAFKAYQMQQQQQQQQQQEEQSDQQAGARPGDEEGAAEEEEEERTDEDDAAEEEEQADDEHSARARLAGSKRTTAAAPTAELEEPNSKRHKTAHLENGAVLDTFHHFQANAGCRSPFPGDPALVGLDVMD
jgi:hypothetical protein